MASCNDCIHSECCFMQYGETKALKWQSQLGCKNFKDRSRFVELPYKLGDVVYFIFERKVIGCVVRRISFDNTKFGANITLDSLDDNNYGTIYGLLADDDCEIFLTREEAKQALKEREEN